MILWLQDKVEVLQYHETEIRSASATWQMPSILKLRKYIRPYQAYQVRLSRTNVFLRDRHICQYCCEKFSLKQLTVDHILPVSRGGKSTWHNLTTACSDCNYRKGNRTPEEAQMELLTKPFKPDWLPSQRETHNLDSFPAAWRKFLRTG